MNEEFYGIAIRKKENKNDFFWKKAEFIFEELEIELSKRYWIADPFIIEDDYIYVFYELYDYFREKGVIAYSKIINGKATKPEIIIEESYHLSFPFIWKDKNTFYLMPESSAARNLVIYEATQFPNKWKKSKVLLENISLCDTIRFSCRGKEYLIGSQTDRNIPLFYCNVKNILFCKRQTGYFLKIDNLNSGDFGVRNAGAVIEDGGYYYRPGQICTNGEYGKGIAIWKLNENFHDEIIEFSSVAEDFREFLKLCKTEKDRIVGVHTYNSSNNYEVVDFKYYTSFNKIEKFTIWFCSKVFTIIEKLNFK